jgi:aspartyl-tRNA(Asn)/glutamyl-tRNA(Gln) amidotransferase subunit A
MNDPVLGAEATAGDIAQAVTARRVPARAVIDAALRRIGAANPQLNAFTAITAERARARAAQIDDALSQGKPVGPLAGVPFAVKNLFDIAGLTTLAGAKINATNAPATTDGALVKRLEGAGAILVGALGMGEYAYDFTGRNAHYGATRNPHDITRMSGGSSGGSGVAVAGGLVPIALGSDTNGSIRVPSSLCGTFGLKPSFGRLSRHGSYPFVSNFDHLGPFARTARDLAATYDALQGHDPNDPSCAPRDIEPASPLLDRGIGDLRIAIAGGYFRQNCGPEALAAVDGAAAALDVTRHIEFPEAARARAAAYIITASEAGAFHLERLKSRANDFDPETRDRLIAGALAPSTWVYRAQRFRSWYRRQVGELFTTVDVVLAPATPVPAPLIDQMTMTLGGVELPVRANLGIFTQPISFIGLPVAAAPIAGPGLPIAIQIIARAWDEVSVLRVAAELERRGIAAAPVATAWKT